MELLGIFTALGTLVQENALAKVSTVSGQLAIWVNGFMLSMLTIWFMVQGFAIMRGESQASINVIVWKATKMLFIFALGMSGVYMSQVVPFIYGIASDLMRVFANASGGECLFPSGDPMGVYKAMDCSANASYTLMMNFFSAGGKIAEKVSIWRSIDGFYNLLIMLIAGIVIAIGTIILYALIGLEFMVTQIGLVLMLCLGPLFIPCAAFEQTKKYFEGWLSKIIYSVVLQAVIILYLGLVVAGSTDMIKRIIGTIPSDASTADMIFSIAAKPMQMILSLFALALMYLIFGFAATRLNGIVGSVVSHTPQASGLGNAIAQTAMNAASGGLRGFGRTASAGKQGGTITGN